MTCEGKLFTFVPHCMFKSPHSDNNTVIQANVTYVFSESNINTNSTFVKEILKINGGITTFTPAMSCFKCLAPQTPNTVI